ncbi:GNAT family N-acetyltransferase [Kitasatospora camelliae]|uniref:GNAT family protein n=1 Tax=Kitasatospora camelliae TaxID=3156397 RepID=A0AAU8JRR5_9ACTN
MPASEPTSEPTFVPTGLDLGDFRLVPWGHDSRTRGFLGALKAAAADPVIALWNPVRATEDISARAWIAARAAGWRTGTLAGFAAVSTDGDTLLGTVNVRWSDRADGLARIGYWTVPAARRRGIAVRATRAATRWAFDTADARRIELSHAAGNHLSCRVAERSGYRHEGTLRDSHRFGDGEYHDEHLHARLARDPEPA